MMEAHVRDRSCLARVISVFGGVAELLHAPDRLRSTKPRTHREHASTVGLGTNEPPR